MKLKRLISFLLVVAMLSGMVVFAAPGDAEFELIAQSDTLALYYKESTSEIAVTDKRTDYTWYSNDAAREEDTVATGSFKMDLSSQLSIRALNVENRVETSKNSYTSCVRKNSVKTEKIANGIKIFYDFADDNITIPMEITLDGDHISARVPVTEIQEGERFKVVSVSMLPHFGDGSTTDTGYMFVPDGSGAIINFNNGKSKLDDYNRPVYGTDLNYSQEMMVTQAEDIRLPVYGVKKNDHAFLAVLDKGAETANIVASVNGKKSSYSSVNAEFTLRYSETFKVSSRSVKIYEDGGKSPSLVEEIKVNFYPLVGADANYSGMARRYKQYLTEEQNAVVSTGEKNDVLIDVLGATQKETTFLGIPYTGITTVTTFDQMQEILSVLKESGINDMTLVATGINKDAVKRKVQTSFSPLRQLGGNGGLKRLRAYLNENGISLFPTADSTNIYKSGNGASKTYGSVANIVGTNPTQYSYKLSTYTHNDARLSWRLLQSEKVLKLANKFTDKLAKKDFDSVAYTTLVNNVYADFGKKVSRSQSAAYNAQALQYSKENIANVMGIKANGFALPSLTHVAQAPIWNSGFEIEDDSVPFYQIALSGLKQVYVPSINLEADREDAFLRAVETNSRLAYSFTYENSTELLNTEFDHLYSTSYTDWKDIASEQYQKIQPVFDATKGAYISQHERLQNGVYKTTYSNGVYTIVNYNSNPVDVNGQTVAAEDFILNNGGEE